MEHVNDALSKLIPPPRQPDADEYVGETAYLLQTVRPRGNSFSRILRAASRQSSCYANAEQRRRKTTQRGGGTERRSE
ncbi:MAG: hypothetical protein ACLRSW_00195 [Christensenellaceae bacterium]